MNDSEPFCGPLQQYYYQAVGFPRLSASPGSPIFARYSENGAVPTLPNITGNTFWFGTQRPNITIHDSTSLEEILSWREAPKRGRRKVILASYHQILIAKVLGSSQFNDGICGFGNNTMPCHSTFTIPPDTTVGYPYTVYWLWDFSGKLGKNTTCTEVRLDKQLVL